MNCEEVVALKNSFIKALVEKVFYLSFIYFNAVQNLQYKMNKT